MERVMEGMKIVISHDIDHLGIREHLLKDLIIPKYIVRSLLELAKRKIPLKTLLKRITNLFKDNSWNNLEELLKFDQKNGINSTFFVAVNNGKYLNYSPKQTRWAMNLIKKYGFDIGVHGIYYNNYEGIKKEYETFKKISGLKKFGIRMHYLRLDKDTLKNLAKAGYLFDTTILSSDLDQAHKIDKIKEIPFHLMDGNLLGIRPNLILQEAKEKTIELLNLARKENKEYVAILFHQRYFGQDFPNWRRWYIWLINYCHQKKYNFINYKDLL